MSSRDPAPPPDAGISAPGFCMSAGGSGSSAYGIKACASLTDPFLASRMVFDGFCKLESWVSHFPGRPALLRPGDCRLSLTVLQTCTSQGPLTHRSLCVEERKMLSLLPICSARMVSVLWLSRCMFEFSRIHTVLD